MYDELAKRRMENGPDGRKYGIWGKDLLRDVVNHRASPVNQLYDTLVFLADTTFVTILDLELPEGDQDAFVGTTFLSGTILMGWFVGLEIDTGTGSSVICYRSKK